MLLRKTARVVIGCDSVLRLARNVALRIESSRGQMQRMTSRETSEQVKHQRMSETTDPIAHYGISSGSLSDPKDPVVVFVC